MSYTLHLHLYILANFETDWSAIRWRMITLRITLAPSRAELRRFKWREKQDKYFLPVPTIDLLQNDFNTSTLLFKLLDGITVSFVPCRATVRKLFNYMVLPHILSPATGISRRGKIKLKMLNKESSPIRNIRNTSRSSTDMFRPSRKMVPFDQPYYIFRIVLTIHGLWPYQTSKVVQVQTAFFFSVYSFFLFFQVFFYFYSDFILRSFSSSSYDLLLLWLLRNSIYYHYKLLAHFSVRNF